MELFFRNNKLFISFPYLSFVPKSTFIVLFYNFKSHIYFSFILVLELVIIVWHGPLSAGRFLFRVSLTLRGGDEMLDLIWFLFDIFQFIWNEFKDRQKKQSRRNRDRKNKN